MNQTNDNFVAIRLIFLTKTLCEVKTHASIMLNNCKTKAMSVYLRTFKLYIFNRMKLMWPFNG